MKTNRILSVILFLVCQISFSQTIHEKRLYGKIIVDFASVNGINVLNLMSGKTAFTNIDGDFFIIAKVGDMLVFSAVNFEPYSKTVTPQDFELKVLLIQMVLKVTELKEVIVNKHPEINAKNLGIIPKNQKTPTPAERRLQTAGDFRPIMLLNLLGGSLPLDPIINKINGRTKRLKKFLVQEKKELYIELISKLYEKEYFAVKLGIPLEYIMGFKYYIVEDEKFLKILESKNEQRISFFMIALAQEYKALIANEN